MLLDKARSRRIDRPRRRPGERNEMPRFVDHEASVFLNHQYNSGKPDQRPDKILRPQLLVGQK